MAGRRGDDPVPVRAARRRRQPHRSAGSVQRHLHCLRSGTEVAVAREFRPLPAAVLVGSILPRHHLSEEPRGLQPRLFRRSDRLGPGGARHPCGALYVCARDHPRGAAGAVGRRSACLVCRSAELAPGAGGGTCGCLVDRGLLSAARSSQRPGHRRHPVQGHLLRPQFPGCGAHLPQHLAVR